MNELLKDFLNDYYNGSLKEMNDDKYFQDKISEFADNQVPIYNYDVNSMYEDCGVSIDDVISEGMIEAMESESDIIKAKQAALYMSYERDLYLAIEDQEEEE